jgi:hypothetical protein
MPAMTDRTASKKASFRPSPERDAQARRRAVQDGRADVGMSLGMSVILPALGAGSL